jgi:hypothetical protein
MMTSQFLGVPLLLLFKVCSCLTFLVVCASGVTVVRNNEDDVCKNCRRVKRDWADTGEANRLFELLLPWEQRN